MSINLEKWEKAQPQGDDFSVEFKFNWKFRRASFSILFLNWYFWIDTRRKLKRIK